MPEQISLRELRERLGFAGRNKLSKGEILALVEAVEAVQAWLLGASAVPSDVALLIRVQEALARFSGEAS